MPVIVDELFPAVRVPPVTLRPPFAVRLAPLPMVKIPLLEVINPVTLPAPFQLPPVTPSVPLIEPPLPISMVAKSVAYPSNSL